MDAGGVSIPLPVVVNGTIYSDGKTTINIEVKDVPSLGTIAVVFDGQRQ
jgi:hypothetical protein